MLRLHLGLHVIVLCEVGRRELLGAAGQALGCDRRATHCQRRLLENVRQTRSTTAAEKEQSHGRAGRWSACRTVSQALRDANHCTKHNRGRLTPTQEARSRVEEVRSGAHLTPPEQTPGRPGPPAARRRRAAPPRCLLDHLAPWGATAQQSQVLVYGKVTVRAQPSLVAQTDLPPSSRTPESLSSSAPPAHRPQQA